jgi:hypothetical protein
MFNCRRVYWGSLGALVVCGSLFGSQAQAKEDVEIPINVGVGPAVYQFGGVIEDNQPLHYGLALDVAAIIDKAAIKKHKDKIPKKYRKMVAKIGEARVGYMLIPDSLFLSPGEDGTSIYGATWRPISVNVPLKLPGMKLKFGAGLVMSYSYIDIAANGDVPASTTHFFRPGLDLRAHLEIPLTESFIVSLGWSSGFYVPQEVGGDFSAMGEGDQSLWQIGQGSLVFNYRFPFKTKL